MGLHDYILLAFSLFSMAALTFFPWQEKQKQILQQLQDQKQITDQWFDLSIDLHCIYSGDGFFTFVSSSSSRLLGYTPEELVGRSILELTHPRDKVCIGSENPDNNKLLSRMRHKEGRWLWFEWVSRVHNGQVFAIAREVTEMQNRHLDLKHWMKVGLDLIAVTDPDDEDRWARVSPGLSFRLGKSERVLTASPWRSLVLQEDVPEKLEGIDEVTRILTKMSASDGKVVFLSWTRIRDDQSGRIYMSAQDVTKSMEQQSALKKTIAELERANIALSRFASVTAHQLRGPPRGIIGSSRVLMEDFSLPEDALAYLRDIQQDALLMYNIVEGLHRISDLQRRGGMIFQLVDLNEVFETIRCSRTRTSTLDDKGPHLEVLEVEPDLPFVFGDKTLLIECFGNIVSNGYKFNKSPVKVVSVSWQQIGKGSIVINVKDNGIGIDLQYKNKLFMVFERLNTEFPGTGVGLYLSQCIVERHKGLIDVEANPEGGSVFKVTLRTVVEGESF